MAIDNLIVPGKTFKSRTKRATDHENQIPKQETKFLFVNERDDTDPNFTFLAAKHVFIKSRSSRMKKEKQLKALKSPVKPFPGSRPLQVSNPGVTSLNFRDHQRSQADEDDRRKPVIDKTIQAGLFEAFPDFPPILSTVYLSIITIVSVFIPSFEPFS